MCCALNWEGFWLRIFGCSFDKGCGERLVTKLAVELSFLTFGSIKAKKIV